MRLLLEIILAAGLIAMAWTKSFKQWASETPVVGRHLTAPAQSPPAKSPVAPATSATPPKVFTGHIYYTDEHGKTYWLDAQGKRHYKP
jgi:hypothetical protein